MVSITVSSETRWEPSPWSASRAAETAVDDAIALRSMQGTCTSPPTGSQVRPRWCSIAISAAFSTWCGVPPRTAQSAPAAIAHAEPTSAWQPPSAPEIDAFALNEGADRGRRQQVLADALSRRTRNESQVVVGDGGDDAGRTVRRRRHDATARGVLLVDREGEGVQPFDRGVARRDAVGRASRCSRRAAARRLTPSPPGRVPSPAQSVGDAFGHRRPDEIETLAGRVGAVDRRLVAPRDFADGDAELVADRAAAPRSCRRAADARRGPTAHASSPSRRMKPPPIE